jgi:hypothetical protein
MAEAKAQEFNRAADANAEYSLLQSGFLLPI